MAQNLNPTFTCECGSTIVSSGRSLHFKTQKHRNFILISEGRTDELIPRKSKFIQKTIGELPDLNKALRYSSKQLRTKPQVLAIQNLRGFIDPYTKANISLENGNLSESYNMDHIHEVQVFVYAINHVPRLSSRAIEHLRTEINDVSNLVITDANVNKSKGQAIKLFLDQLDTVREQPLIAALVQVGTGGLRQIAGFSAQIVGLICKYSNIMILEFYAHNSVAFRK
jgi:hypothetical protein